MARSLYSLVPLAALLYIGWTSIASRHGLGEAKAAS